MASHPPVETAKIFQFPKGGRAGMSTRTSTIAPMNELELAAASRIAVGGSWYHDAAVLEEKKDNQH